MLILLVFSLLMNFLFTIFLLFLLFLFSFFNFPHFKHFPHTHLLRPFPLFRIPPHLKEFFASLPLCLIFGSHITTLTKEAGMEPDKGFKHVTLQERISFKK